MFRPYVHSVHQPRQSGTMGTGIGQLQTSDPVGNVIVPVPTTVDLLTIPSPANEKDFFVWLPHDSSLDRVLIGAAADVTLSGSPTFQIVQRRGLEFVEINTATTITDFGIIPVELATSGKVSNGPVFLRVKMAAVDHLLFVTVFALTPEIP